MGSFSARLERLSLKSFCFVCILLLYGTRAADVEELNRSCGLFWLFGSFCLFLQHLKHRPSKLARFVDLKAKSKQEFLDVERTQAVCCCNFRSECQSVFARSPAIYSHSPFSTLVEKLVPQNLLYMSLFVFHCDIRSKFFKQQFGFLLCITVVTSKVKTAVDRNRRFAANVPNPSLTMCPFDQGFCQMRMYPQNFF